jgi:hypothetical protein
MNLVNCKLWQRNPHKHLILSRYYVDSDKQRIERHCNLTLLGQKRALQITGELDTIMIWKQLNNGDLWGELK